MSEDIRKMTISDLQPEDRPREKLEARGAASLSSSELLAILIGSGYKDENAVSLMQRLITDCGSLSRLSRLTISELCGYKGIGKAKAVTIIAALELGKRRLGEEAGAVKQFTSSDCFYRYFLSKVQDHSVEESHLMMLNQNLRLIGSRLISRGGITGTVVDIRRVAKEALIAGVTHIALCHNHPSGNSRPSREDDNLTRRLKEGAATVDIRLLDHIIVTETDYFSYQDEGRL